MSEERKVALVPVVGRANVGKSSLVNALVGEKVSIVSAVPQTTRTRIRAILTEERGQLVFLDTPGLHKSEHAFNRLMNRMARSSIEGADLALLVVDRSVPPREEDIGWMTRLRRSGLPCVMALNKSDLPERHDDEYRQAWASAAQEGAAEPAAVVAVSAATGEGLDELLNTLFQLAPQGPLLFDQNILTDYPRRLAIADVVREKYFHVLRQEVPHALAVEIYDLREQPSAWHADGFVYVQKDSQKGIVLGSGGSLLKRVREEAEQELSELYGIPVKLHLRVKVRRHWDTQPHMLRRLGYLA